MELPEPTLIPNPTLEEQVAFLSANKDAMHFVVQQGDDGLFPCIALYMVSTETGTNSLPFRFAPITPAYQHLIYLLTNAAAINHDHAKLQKATPDKYTEALVS